MTRRIRVNLLKNYRYLFRLDDVEYYHHLANKNYFFKKYRKSGYYIAESMKTQEFVEMIERFINK